MTLHIGPHFILTTPCGRYDGLALKIRKRMFRRLKYFAEDGRASALCQAPWIRYTQDLVSKP